MLEQVLDPGHDRPEHAVFCQQLPDRTSMIRDAPEVLVRNQQIDHAVVRVTLEDPVDAGQRNGHRLGREVRRLAKRAAETAAPCGEQDSEADNRPERYSERYDHWWMGQALQLVTERLSDLMLAVAHENAVEAGANLRRQDAIVAPQTSPAPARRAWAAISSARGVSFG